MLFIDALFIPFVIVAWVAYVAAPPKARIWVILASSAVFHACNGGRNLAIFFSVVTVNLLLARFLVAPKRRGSLQLAIVFNLLVLAYFKYAGILSWGHLKTGPLPLGISFYIFQYIAFQSDVYSGKAPLPPATYGAGFVAFFPHLIAGPIVRARELVPQMMKAARPSALDIEAGVTRFCWGMAKKRIIADNLATTVQLVFDHRLGVVDPLSAGAALLGYTVQLYFDFSGYADMAIGIARCFGLVFPENFDAPYTSTSMTEFWRRWHMSLSQWLRDYLFTPIAMASLGKTRLARWRPAFNVIVTMTVCGLWHNGTWPCIVFGVLHGVYMAVEQELGIEPVIEQAGPLRVARQLLVLLLVCIANSFFRAPSMGVALSLLGSVIGLNAHADCNANFQGTMIPMSAYAVVVAVIAAGTLATRELSRWLTSDWVKGSAALRGATVAGLVFASYLFGPQQADFLYWKF
jgi:alginate O-acetyltransferase complex protein AlgI